MSARRGRVLVIDDEPAITTAIRRMLGSEHDIVSATSAAAALEVIAGGGRFDLILCDLMMPAMSGMQFHAELARVAPDLVGKIVFLTGGAFTAHAHQFLDAVSNPRIEKPFDYEALRAFVNDRVR